nr:PadR family transcriptional regulator [Natronobeatus ordinarius]
MVSVLETPYSLTQVNVDVADERELVADGGTSWADLTGFQRDCLEAILHLENADETTYGLAISRELEDQYGDVNHGRLYPNLDELVDVGFVELGQVDRRTNSYTLTSSGRAVLEERAHTLADACGLSVAVTDGGDDA